MELKVFQRDKLKRADVSGGEADLRSDAGFEGLRPTLDAEAPGIAGFETGEIVFGPWGREVIAARATEGQEFCGDDSADSVQAGVFGSGPAVAVAIEAGERGGATALQGGAEDVGWHSKKRKRKGIGSAGKPFRPRGFL